MRDALMSAEQVPHSLYNRALAAGYEIVGAHREGRLIVMPASDTSQTQTEEVTPEALEARIAPSALSDADWIRQATRRLVDTALGSDPAAPTPLTPNARTASAAAAILTANRDNPAWQAGGMEDEADGPMPDLVPVDSLVAAIQTAMGDGELHQIAALILDGARWPGVSEDERGRFLSGLYGWMRGWAVGELVAMGEAA
jgi:hypothetical protein